MCYNLPRGTPLPNSQTPKEVLLCPIETGGDRLGSVGRKTATKAAIDQLPLFQSFSSTRT